MGTVRVDLHVHSVESGDADYDWSEICAMALDAGVSVLAFCEHDSLVSARWSLGKGTASPVFPDCSPTPHPPGRAGLTFVPGVEVTCDYRGEEVHVLGYGVDPDSTELVALIAHNESERRAQFAARARGFRALGLRLKEAEASQVNGGRAMTVAPLLKALALANPGSEVLRPYLRVPALDCRKFRLDYLDKGRPCYAPARWAKPEEAIKAVVTAGGQPVLAHPGVYRFLTDPTVADGFLARLAGAGLTGLESFSTYHDAGTSPRFERLAAEHGLVSTVGSDFHGPSVKPRVRLGDPAWTPGRVHQAVAAWVERVVSV